ncbi:DUF421 domain-containing protein [Methylomusa anaerophila]|uniref:YetF C-terminal domain-containing protein n=1 Tax=Methylomusa anaerophila TaxID=1930071 RepID=A0A348AP43_9FIRM|nr:hypothetical protein MAMMFC1_03549 [Methylomusa anaerophila]
MLEIGAVGQVFLRLVILFVAALFVVRIMGNRTVGQLSPFDFVIMVGIGDIIVAGAMDRNPTLIAGAEGLLALLVLQQVIAYLALKNTTLRKWFEGIPITLVKDGKILKDNFNKTQFNFDDLRQELHKKGLDFTDLKDIQLARLESCGEFSLIRTPETEPLTKRDFENYIKSIYENPLSLTGEKWAKFESFMNDVDYLATYIKQLNQNLPSQSDNQVIKNINN